MGHPPHLAKEPEAAQDTAILVVLSLKHFPLLDPKNRDPPCMSLVAMEEVRMRNSAQSYE